MERTREEKRARTIRRLRRFIKRGNILGAMDSRGCHYVTKDGKRCALGALLTREEAERAEVHGYGPALLCDQFRLHKRTGMKLTELGELQRAHDQDTDRGGVHFPELLDRLRRIESGGSLTAPCHS